MKKFSIVSLITLMWALGSPLVLAQGDPVAGQTKAALCAACHGNDGNSPLAINPKLAGQNAKYLVKQLQDYKSGRRVNPVMTGMAAALTEEDMEDISAWYASQTVTLGGADPELLELGQSIYRSGVEELSVAACSACHSPTGRGNSPAGFPALSGQYPEYTLLQLKSFRSGERANDMSSMMRTVVKRLSDRELQALASYLSGLH
ncbi:MAG: c-type cytochrome [Gammaproteobacteria bacterium]|nr:c-type cytochrome [Gammaproteobacteria bacterium]